MNRVYLVLRHSREYDARCVLRLVKLLPPGTAVTLLADAPVAHPQITNVPLKYDWPGWWSKLELFRPDIEGDVFYMDLDTTPLGDISAHANIGKTTLLRDFYRPNGLQSSLMYLTEKDRRNVWRWWNPGHIARYSSRRAGLNGDQNFLEDVLGVGPRVCRWQDELPGTCISYKVESRSAGWPPMKMDNVNFIIFHGKPRPWQVGL